MSQATGLRVPVESGGKRVPNLFQRRLADGTIRYEFVGRVDGRPTRRKLAAQTKTDAIAEARGLKVDVDRGEVRKIDRRLTVNALADDFMADLEARVGSLDRRRRRSQRTVDGYRQVLDTHVLPVIGRTRVADVDVAVVREVLRRARGLAPSTTANILTALSSLLEHGMAEGVVLRNPVRDLPKRDRPGREPRRQAIAIGPEQTTKLLAAMGDTFRPVAAVMAYAGLRVSEALGLTWEDVDLKAKTLRVDGQLLRGDVVATKTHESKASVPLLPALERELLAHRDRVASTLGLPYLQPDAFVFATRTGQTHDRRNVHRAIAKAGETIGVDGVGPHSLRHSFISNAIAAGLTLAEASELGRHSNVATTARAYAHVTVEAKARLGTALVAGGFGG